VLASLRHGVGLRHVPIALPSEDDASVRLEIHRPGGTPVDVTHEHAAVSLRPMIVGVRLALPAGRESSSRCSLVLVDAPTGTRLGELALEPAGSVPLSIGRLSLFRTAGCRSRCAPASVRWWRYALAWVHARRSASRGDALRMTAAELRCFDVYSIAPRPLFAVGVGSDAHAGMFTASLVTRVGSGDVLLSLPASSPEIAGIEASGRLALSAAPAGRLAEMLALGAYERRHATPSPVASGAAPASAQPGLPALPTLADAHTRELSVLSTHRVGSDVLFVCRVDHERGSAGRRIAYVSAMYAEWLERNGRPVDALA
jgi:hypothetical protein